MSRLGFASGFFLMASILSGVSMQAQSPEIAQQQAQFQTQAKVLNDAVQSHIPSPGVNPGFAQSTVSQSTIVAGPIASGTVVFGTGLYGPVYGHRGYRSGYRGFGPGHYVPGFGRPVYPLGGYHYGRPFLLLQFQTRPGGVNRLPTTGSHYFGNPHASQYFPR